MKEIAVASELVKVAKLLSAAADKTDSAEDIASDVLTRMDTGMGIAEAFKAVGYADLYRKTRETDMPDDWESLQGNKRLKILTQAIEKSMKRQKKASGSVKVAKEKTAHWGKGVYRIVGDIVAFVVGYHETSFHVGVSNDWVAEHITKDGERLQNMWGKAITKEMERETGIVPTARDHGDVTLLSIQAGNDVVKLIWGYWMTAVATPEVIAYLEKNGFKKEF